MAKKKLPPELDPIFPIVAGFEIPPVPHEGGKEIMQRTDLVTITLPYRSFYFLWEVAERRGAEQYPKYVGTQLDHAAQTWLDAVHAFRSAAAGVELKRFTEAKAQKARAILAKHAKAQAERAKAARAAKNKPGEAVAEPVEANPEAPKARTRKRPSDAQKGSKGSKKRKPRSATSK